MKKLMILSCVLAAQFSYGQFEDNKWLLGGNVYYNTNSDNNSNSNQRTKSTSSSTSLAPSVGWVLKSDAIIGVQPRIAKYVNENSNQTYKSNSVGFDIYYRKYKSLEDNLFLTFQGATGFSWRKYTTSFKDDPSSPIKNDSRSFDVSLVPGLAYKATDWLMLEARLGQLRYNNYFSSRSQNESSSKSNSFNFSFNNIGFGFVVIF